MRSSDLRRSLGVAAVMLAASMVASRAQAQAVPRAPPQAQGFAVERLYPSAPGGGWFVMDALDMHGGLGGVMALTTGYSLDALRVPDGSGHLNVVSDRGYADFGFAITYDRYRLYLNLDAPFVSEGGSGSAGGYVFSGPSLALPNSPDTLSDARVGFDARIVGESDSPFRLGAGAQLFIPNGERADYITDGSYRAMLRVLAAGDVGMLTYAAQLGVHIRPLDDAPAPGSPQGSELLFGVASGVRLPLGASGGSTSAFVMGPEIFGATAFRSFFGGTTTALEGLLSARYEGTSDQGLQLRLKLGTGGGIDQEFGAPAWRAVFSIEVFGREPVSSAAPPERTAPPAPETRP